MTGKVRKFLLLSIVAPLANSSLVLFSKDGEASSHHQQMYGVSASMLPPLPSGQTLKLLTSQGSGLLGGTVWPAAVTMCTYLLENRQELSLSTSNCVELGSGTGAVGLFAAGLGAKSVVLTDCRPPPDAAMYTTDGTSTLPPEGSADILNLLQKNVKANNELFPHTTPRVVELDWTKQDNVERLVKNEGFDIVLASDVTHFSLMHKPLATTIARLLRQDGGLCLLSHQERMVNLKGLDMQLHQFESVARSVGLGVEHVPVGSSFHNGGESQADTRTSMLLMHRVDSKLL